MEDVTNYLNNIGKQVKDQEFCILLSFSELTALKALAQNPHPEYQSSSFKEVFDDLRRIVESIQEREVRRQIREDDIDF